MNKYIILVFVLFLIGTPLCAEESPRSLPEITAPDLAVFEGINWVKGRLPNQDGFRIKNAQVFIGEENEKDKAVTQKLKVEYSSHRYSDTGELSDPMGFLYVAIQQSDGGLKICLVVKNRKGTLRTESLIENLKGYSVAMTANFMGETGNTTSDYGYVVPVGETKIFTLSNEQGSIKTLTLKCEPVGSLNSESLRSSP